jgi:hypothetical protein
MSKNNPDSPINYQPSSLNFFKTARYSVTKNENSRMAHLFADLSQGKLFMNFWTSSAETGRSETPTA